MPRIDLDLTTVRELNAALHGTRGTRERAWTVMNPKGRHNLACGIEDDLSVSIHGHVGYYCSGMNKRAHVSIRGNCGVGVAENMMSGTVRVAGDASQSAGATGRGGLLVIEGNASARCGISMKGIDIVVRGDVGHMACFMGQAGRLVICGGAADGLGDSLYEARIYVRGAIKSLGADCIQKKLHGEHRTELKELLDAAGFHFDPDEFRRYGSARRLYNFNIDHVDEY